MTITDALTILNLSGSVTPEDIKTAYREAARKYHPDHNPGGEEMMKLINGAYEAFADWSGEAPEMPEAAQGRSYPDAVNEALRVVINLDGLDSEICGSWVWVGGNTYPYRTVLKAAGFRFAPHKKRWYFRPEGWRSSSRGRFTMEEIRNFHGSIRPTMARSRRMAYADDEDEEQ